MVMWKINIVYVLYDFRWYWGNSKKKKCRYEKRNSILGWYWKSCARLDLASTLMGEAILDKTGKSCNKICPPPSKKKKGKNHTSKGKPLLFCCQENWLDEQHILQVLQVFRKMLTIIFGFYGYSSSVSKWTSFGEDSTLGQCSRFLAERRSCKCECKFEQGIIFKKYV